jgi:hypothetical protein
MANEPINIYEGLDAVYGQGEINNSGLIAILFN